LGCELVSDKVSAGHLIQQATMPSSTVLTSQRQWLGKNRKPIAWLLLSVLPLLMILVTFQVQRAGGPYWLRSNLDPTYPYLLNSLNVANGHRPFLTEHPGTPVEVVGGVIIRALNGVTSERATAEKVIASPEYYIGFLNKVFIIFYALCLLVSGYVAFSVTQDILSAIAVQASPLISTTIFTGLMGLRPEPMLVSISTLFVVLILLTLKFDSAKYARRYSLAFGLLAGVGMACKFTFFPLVLTPIILLPSWKHRMRYALSALAAFVISIAPIIAPYQLRGLFGLIFQTTVHTGEYGTGSAGLINIKNYLDGALLLIKGDTLFFMVVMAGLLALIVGRGWLRLPGARYRALLAVSIAEVFQLLLVAKQPAQRYLLPVLALGGLNLILVLDSFKQRLSRGLRPYYYAFVMVLLVFMFLGRLQTMKRLDQSLADVAQKQLSIYQRVENEYRGVPVVRYFSASSPMYALRLGSEWSNNFYGQLLQERYPNNFFWSPATGRFHNFAEPVDLSQIVNSNGWFIMHGLSFKDHFFQIYPVKPLPDSLELECLYDGEVDRTGVIDEAIYKATVKKPLTSLHSIPR
jgi:hypothetical protein